MAYNSTFTPAAAGYGKAFITGVGEFFSMIGRVLVAMSNNDARLRKVASLQAKTDEELQAMGIKRDDIVHHVFRDLYYI